MLIALLVIVGADAERPMEAAILDGDVAGVVEAPAALEGNPLDFYVAVLAKGATDEQFADDGDLPGIQGAHMGHASGSTPEGTCPEREPPIPWP